MRLSGVTAMIVFCLPLDLITSNKVPFSKGESARKVASYYAIQLIDMANVVYQLSDCLDWPP